MSYILDALRKADAERERDPARGIHAQAMTPQPAARRPPMAAWAGAGLVAVALAGYAWSQRGVEQSPPAVRVPVATQTDPMPKGAAPAVITVATSVQPAAPPPLPEPVKAPVAVVKAPAALPAASAPSAPSAKADPAAERIYAQTELPQDVQQALPKLAISGGVYSENVAQRMLIVGGQVV